MRPQTLLTEVNAPELVGGVIIQVTEDGSLLFSQPADDSDSKARVIYDMYGDLLRPDDPILGAHEGSLAEVAPPAFDWFYGARRGVIGPYPANGYSSPNASPVTVWGAHNAWNACVPVGGMAHTVTNVRVHYDQLEICHFNIKTGAWTIIRQGEPTMAKKAMTGGYYQVNPFGKKAALGSHYRKEDSGWSVDLSPLIDTTTGHPSSVHSLLHTFWGDLYPRIKMGDGKTKGTTQVAIRIKARLISDDPSVDLTQAQFMSHTCGDLFRDTNSSTDPSGVNPPFALPRFKRLTADWQYFGHVTGSPQELSTMPDIPFLK